MIDEMYLKKGVGNEPCPTLSGLFKIRLNISEDRWIDAGEVIIDGSRDSPPQTYRTDGGNSGEITPANDPLGIMDLTYREANGTTGHLVCIHGMWCFIETNSNGETTKFGRLVPSG